MDVARLADRADRRREQCEAQAVMADAGSRERFAWMCEAGHYLTVAGVLRDVALNPDRTL